MGYLFTISQTRSLPSLPWKERNAISVAVAQLSGASWQCALGYIGVSARENLDRRDAPESAYHDRNLFSEDRTWPTVGSPPGRKPRVLQHYPKTTPTADQLRAIFWSSVLSSAWKRVTGGRWTPCPEFWSRKFYTWMNFSAFEVYFCFKPRLRRRFEGETPASGITDGRICGACQRVTRQLSPAKVL